MPLLPYLFQGKGEMITYWLDSGSGECMSSSCGGDNNLCCSDVEETEEGGGRGRGRVDGNVPAREGTKTGKNDHGDDDHKQKKKRKEVSTQTTAAAIASGGSCYAKLPAQLSTNRADSLRGGHRRHVGAIRPPIRENNRTADIFDLIQDIPLSASGGNLHPNQRGGIVAAAGGRGPAVYNVNVNSSSRSRCHSASDKDMDIS